MHLLGCKVSTNQLVKLSLHPYASSCHCFRVFEVELVVLGFKVILVATVHSMNGSTVHKIAIASEDLENELVVLV